MLQKIPFGTRVRDVITRFEGTATAYCLYMTGCNQYGVAARVSGDGKSHYSWFDETRVEAVDDVDVIVLPERELQASPGGPQETPSKT